MTRIHNSRRCEYQNIEYKPVTALTIGSDCRMAETKYFEAEGVASKARIMPAPLLWPASVIFEELAPKEEAIDPRKSSALMTSVTARFVLPSGDKNPSYKQL